MTSHDEGLILGTSVTAQQFQMGKRREFVCKSKKANIFNFEFISCFGDFECYTGIIYCCVRTGFDTWLVELSKIC